jgi:cellulose synthase (UDP-forming)
MVGIAVLLIFTLPLAYSAIVVPLSAEQQAAAAVALIAAAAIGSFSRSLRPFIIFLSAFASARYLYWRISSTVNMDSTADAIASLLLLSAEIYGLVILFLGYFQTVELTHRTPPPVPDPPPTVDVLIPTYNEPVDILRRTVIGALAMDYPAKRVYVLDDGRRPEISEMAASLGAIYLTRANNEGAKAGNLNHALRQTTGELVAIFDADHVPVRSFLAKTAGFFANPKLGLVQTAQHFYNPDPYERNLNLTGRVAPEQNFFYHVIQPGNDFWNAAFFCGSCAVLRRSALDSVGGFRTRTVTEDSHTALELHAKGWHSVYLRMPLAAGLAAETFAAHVKQRIRWARGMAQILRVDCPLLKRGLSLPQRLNYFNAMLHFFFGVPRLILILAPLAFLFGGLHPLKADSLAVIAYILPHISLSTIANSIISRRYRHSFWAAVYEVSIAPYTAAVTLMALINPRFGKFNVTEKGASLAEARYDVRSSMITVGLLAFTLAGLVVAFPWRLGWFAYEGREQSELDAIVINSIWTLGNLLVLAAAACVGFEQPQQRRAPRIRHDFEAQIHHAGETVRCRTVDISETGVRVRLGAVRLLPSECRIAIGSTVYVAAERTRYDWAGTGEVEAAFDFRGLSDQVRHQLVRLIFCEDESWTRQHYPEDRLLRSFWYLVTTPWRATKARRTVKSLAPAIFGRWKCFYGSLTCVCTQVSGADAVVRFEGEAPAPSVEHLFRIEMEPGLTLEANAALVDRNRLEFRWPDRASEAVFWETLYTAESARKPVIPSPWGHWIEDLK